MKSKKLSFLLTFTLLSSLIFAQPSSVIRKYIDTYKDIAIAEELRTGVPAAITLAQGIHETGAGTSDLVISSNNHFGIKCKSNWAGPAVYHDDDAKGECFRKYENPVDSYKDHSDFLRNRPYYTALFSLDPTDYEAWAYGLKKAGYATNPRYPQILIKLIKDYGLQEYTLTALEIRQKDPSGITWANGATSLKSESSFNARTEERKSTFTGGMKSYPSGVFHINDTKVTFITKGTSYLKVAEENRVSLSRLFDYNEMRPADVAAEDHLLYLQRKKKTGANEFHVVSEGETLDRIAQVEGMRLESLLEFNMLRPGMQPRTGERLYLKTKAPISPKVVTNTTFTTTAVRP